MRWSPTSVGSRSWMRCARPHPGPASRCPGRARRPPPTRRRSRRRRPTVWREPRRHWSRPMTRRCVRWPPNSRKRSRWSAMPPRELGGYLGELPVGRQHVGHQAGPAGPVAHTDPQIRRRHRRGAAVGAARRETGWLSSTSPRRRWPRCDDVSTNLAVELADAAAELSKVRSTGRQAAGQGSHR